jgi:uncharacterized membrane protein YhaH (DUF805 family)
MCAGSAGVLVLCETHCMVGVRFVIKGAACTAVVLWAMVCYPCLQTAATPAEDADRLRQADTRGWWSLGQLVVPAVGAALVLGSRLLLMLVMIIVTASCSMCCAHAMRVALRC